MIEFAPNPSGPAHLGTLRSYAVAWLEAKKQGLPLFLRYDAVPHRPYCPLLNVDKWAFQFHTELLGLDMLPDHWQIVREPICLAALPAWAITRPMEDSSGPWAYYPTGLEKHPVPSADSTDWKSGGDIPMNTAIRTGPFVMQEVAQWNDWTKNWELCLSQAYGMHMHLRGTKTIVRALNTKVLREYMEVRLPEFFGYNIPDVLYTGMVCTADGGLSKSKLQEGDYGTVDRAMRDLTPAGLRERIFASARDDERMIIPVQDILES